MNLNIDTLTLGLFRLTQPCANEERLISIPANKNRELVLTNFYRLFNYQSAFPQSSNDILKVNQNMKNFRFVTSLFFDGPNNSGVNCRLTSPQFYIKVFFSSRNYQQHLKMITDFLGSRHGLSHQQLQTEVNAQRFIVH